MNKYVKKYSEEELLGMLQRIYPDYVSGTPEKRKLIAEQFWKTFGFSSQKQFESFFAKEVERFKQPTISSARGKKFVPIPMKLLKEYNRTQKEIAPFGPSESRQAAELRMEGLADKASGEKKTFYDVLTFLQNTLESAAPVGGPTSVVKGRIKRTRLSRAAKSRARQAAQQRSKRQAREAFKRLPKKEK